MQTNSNDTSLITLNELLTAAENTATEAAQQWATVPGTQGIVKHRLAFAAANLLTAATEPGKITRNYAAEKINRATADLVQVCALLNAGEQITFHPNHRARLAMDDYNDIMNDCGGSAYAEFTGLVKQGWGEDAAAWIGIAVSNAAMGVLGYPDHQEATITTFKRLSRLATNGGKETLKLQILNTISHYLTLFEKD